MTSPPASWVDVLPADRLPPDRAVRVRAGELRLLVGPDPGADGVFAVVDVCPHLDLPLAAFGPVEVRRERLICPWHYWEFDVRSGQCLYAPLYQDAEMFFFQIEGKDHPAAGSAGCLTRIPSRIHAGQVQVLLPPATP